MTLGSDCAVITGYLVVDSEHQEVHIRCTCAECAKLAHLKPLRNKVWALRIHKRADASGVQT